jgi:P-type E1-E2 ATPase
LNKVAENREKITVWRDGESKDIGPRELLCGDVVEIAVGIMVPCDGFIVSGRDITIDESSMTGETDMIKKCTLEVAIKKMNQLKNEGTFETDAVE